MAIHNETLILNKLASLERQIALMSAQIDFIRTRTSSYVGDNISLTYLIDETPLYVNSNDFGCPFNFLNGGEYESDNLNILLSFVKDDTIFLDVGANLGFFSLQVARRVARQGRVYAFEPNPDVAKLLERNAYVNGFGRFGHGKEVITCHAFGLSDHPARVQLSYPIAHLGGGSIAAPGREQVSVTAEVRRLDDVFGDDFVCDLVKIDVEGHELQVLRGMQNILSRSKNIKIMFEKLSADAGAEPEIERLFGAHDLKMYGVQPDASLQELAPGQLAEWTGYVLATRLGAKDGLSLSRSLFCIYPRQLFTSSDSLKHLSRDSLIASGKAGQLLCYGPYWFLRAGVYRFRLHGAIEGNVSVTIAARFGHCVLEFSMATGDQEKTIVVERDVVHFECVIRSASAALSTLRLEMLEFLRIG